MKTFQDLLKKSTLKKVCDCDRQVPPYRQAPPYRHLATSRHLPTAGFPTSKYHYRQGSLQAGSLQAGFPTGRVPYKQIPLFRQIPYVQVPSRQVAPYRRDHAFCSSVLSSVIKYTLPAIDDTETNGQE